MFTTIDIHYHPDDTVVEVNESRNGIVIHEPGNHDPRVTIFLGNTPAEISENVTTLTETLQELRLAAIREMTR